MTSVQRSKVSSLHLDISLQSENEIKKRWHQIQKHLRMRVLLSLFTKVSGRFRRFSVTRPRLPSFRSAANIALFDISLRFIR